MAAALPLVFMAAQPVVDGMSYEFVMKTTSTQTGNKETVTLRGRGVHAGDNAKIEMLNASPTAGGQSAFGGKGTYFILRNAGQEMLLVDPKEKSYMQWDMAKMMAGMGQAINAAGGMVKMEMSDIRIDAQDMGAGPTIQGYATRHIRMVQNYTMNTTILGRGSRNRSEATSDLYFAPSLKIANPFVSNSQAMSMMSQLDVFNNPDYKRQMEAANAKLPRTGVPVRTVTTIVSTDEKGKSETSTSVMEMMNFKASNIPASEFEIPSDYTKIEMPSIAGAPGAQNAGNSNFAVDSLGGAAKEGAKDGAKKEARDIGKEAAAGAANKLKGVFGGKKPKPE
jgi:hypothetical protein